MKRFAWITDPHFNFVEREAFESFCDTLAATNVDGVLLGGDIGEAYNIGQYLEPLATRLSCPIYFVLGNHDFYRGTIAGVREKIENICTAFPRLVWLPRAGLVELTPTTGLVGHDGWADGRLGDYQNSTVFLNDYLLIGEFRGLDDRQRLELL